MVYVKRCFVKTEILLKERARELRKAAGLSQAELGKVLGLTQKAVSTMESGLRGTTIEKLVLLAEYFHVSTDYLLGLTDDPAWRGRTPEQSGRNDGSCDRRDAF